jgi:lipoprotein-anchoring transpeptidase ErfK/SrfK
MRGLISSAGAVLGGIAFASTAASAEVSISVNKTTQRMTVSVDGQERHSWPVSTGMADYSTPTGAFAPSRLAKVHYSREWDNAPMPHSIFFTDAGHAIHGSRATGFLGLPASHGCIRLSPQNARILFDLVMAEGLDNTRIEVTGVDPIGMTVAGGSGSRHDYSRLTSFDPLKVGIMAGGEAARRRTD